MERKTLVEAIRRLGETPYERVDMIFHERKRHVSEFADLMVFNTFEETIRDIELFFLTPTLEVIDNEYIELKETRIAGPELYTEVVLRAYRLGGERYAVIHMIQTIRES